MKRFVNIRIPVLTACFLAAGIGLGCLFAFRGISLVWLVATVPVAALIVVPSLFKNRKRIVILTLLFSLFFVFGSLYSFFTIQSFGVCDVESEKSMLITGRVTETGSTKYGEYIIIDHAEADGEKLSGKVRVFLSENYGDYCDVGYTVMFYAKLQFNETFPYGKLNYYAENNIKYVCSPYGYIKSAYGFSFFGSIRNAIKSTLFNNLDYDTAAVCYGMLIGDTEHVDEETLDTFRYGGIAHIFAVSGLHIGIVYAIFTFILDKFKTNKYVSAAVRLFAIIFYAGICGFTVSSIRAVIMCAAYMLAKLLYVKSDGLNNLAFAVILILIIKPLNLFSVGFQLSVCAVGGIILFAKSINRVLKKTKIPDKITNGAGATFGAQIGTLPVTLAHFGYLSGAGLVLNLLIIPLVSLLFVILFVGLIISLIIPSAANFLMNLAALPLETTLSFLLRANFEKALIKGFGAGVFVPIYFAAMALISDKINLKVLTRGAVAACSVATLSITVLMLTYMPVNGVKLSVSTYDNSGCVLLKSSEGNVLVMTENMSSSRTLNLLNREYATDLDGVVIIGGENCVETYDLSLGCKDVYVCSLYIPVQMFQTVYVHYVKDFELCGMRFSYSDGYTLTAEIDGVSTMICGGPKIPAIDCDLLISLYPNSDFDGDGEICNADYTVYFNLRGAPNNAYDYGDLKFYLKDGCVSGLAE